MREIVEQDLPIRRLVLKKEEAVRIFAQRGQTLKVELIQEKGGSEVTCYEQGNFIDFCLGPHLPSTGYIKHFKLLSVSGAYWKGDERGPQLQRIYGTAFSARKNWIIIFSFWKRPENVITAVWVRSSSCFRPATISELAWSSGSQKAQSSVI